MDKVMDYRDELIALVKKYGPDLLLALVTLVVGFWLVRIIVGILDKALAKSKAEESLRSFLNSLTRIALRIIVLIIVAGILGIETNSLVAIIGAAGIAIGLALKGNLSNLAGGVMILFVKPFKVGDWIEAQGYVGHVVQIQVFHTILNTPDNRRVYIPNGPLSEGTLVNITAEETRRIDLTFGISYDDDMNKAASLIRKVVEADERILTEPAPLIAVGELADSSVNFTVRVWCKTMEYWDIYWEIHQKVKEAFDTNDITIPFPQQDVHMYQTR